MKKPEDHTTDKLAFELLADEGVSEVRVYKYNKIYKYQGTKKTQLLKEKKKTQDKEKKKIPVEFEELWLRYPLKTGKKHALTHYRATVRTIEQVKKINVALDNYTAYITQRDAQKPFLYWKGGAVWFNEWEDWVNFESPFASPQEDKKFVL